MAILISRSKVTPRESQVKLGMVPRGAGTHSVTDLSWSRSEHAARGGKAGGLEQEDQELVYHLLTGDRSAAVRFVYRFERLIHRQIHDLGVLSQDHDDLFQEVFLHLWEEDYRRLRLWRGQGKFSSFLRVVVRHLIQDRQRARPSVPVSDALPSEWPEWEEGPGNPVEILLSKEQKDAIHHTLECLSKRDRALLQRRYLLTESYREIGAAMGITTNNVGVSLKNAELRFKKKFHSLYPGLVEIG